MPGSDGKSGIEEMDRLFRRIDFAAENEGLEDRLWERIFGFVETDEERELEAESFSLLRRQGRAQMAQRRNQRCGKCLDSDFQHEGTHQGANRKGDGMRDSRGTDGLCQGRGL